MREFENEIPKIDFDQSRCKFGAHQIKSIRVKYIITYVVSEFIANKLKTSLKTRYTKITMIVIMAIEEERERLNRKEHAEVRGYFEINDLAFRMPHPFQFIQHFTPLTIVFVLFT